MKKVLGFSLVAAFLVACGSSGGSSGPSYSEMKAKFDKPTGELKGDNAKSVGSALEEKMKKGNVPGALSAVKGALDVVSGQLEDSPITCTQPTNYTGGTVTIHCACNGGGEMTYTMDPMTMGSDGKGPFSVTYAYKACKIVQDDQTIIYNGSGTVARSGASAQDMYYSFKGTVEVNGKVETIDIEYYQDETGKVWFLVSVNDGTKDGTFVVNGAYDSTTGSGQWSVKDSSGKTYSCTATNGTGSCEADDGTKMEF